MKRVTLGLFFLVPIIGFAQTQPLEKINAFVNENRSKLALTTQDVSDLVIVNDFSSESTGINNYHVKQRYHGIEVYNSDSNFWIKDGKVINGGDEFIKNIGQKVNTTTPSKSVTAAVLGVLSQLDNTQLSSTQIIESNGNEYKLSNGALTNDPIRAELVYFLTNSNALKLAWDYEFYSQDTKHLWSLKVDAVNGKILEKRDLVISCNFGGNHNDHSHSGFASTKELFKGTVSNMTAANPGTTTYNVIPWNYESPNHSPRVLVSNPEYTTNASPNGWHNSSTTIGGTTTTYNITRGNNTYAYADRDGNNSVDAGSAPTASAGTYPDLTFDFPYGGNAVAANTYIPASVTNLFYGNNIMHDLWYQYGFNEANKNFQVTNYGRGGSGNDPVLAEAQDGATAATPGVNNSNFSLTAEGTSPRMQMFLWNIGKPINFTVTTPPSVAGSYSVNDNGFSPGHVNLPVAPATLTSDLVLYVDGSPDTSDACTAATNAAALNGKIAVIRRGTCTFISKVKLAQNAGAIGVIVVNNEEGPNIRMGGADVTVTIPAVSIAQAEGEALIAAMASGTVNVSMSIPEIFVNTDGDFDNGIIAHEYGHGISHRLSGGCLLSAEQPGEGWSDWFWLMMQIKPGDTRNDARGIGTFAFNQPPSGLGIREYRYSTDMAVNPHTYGDTNEMFVTDANGNEQINVHAVGSVWCAMLWDLAWNYIDKYGYDPNIYTGTGGNNKIMRLVLDAIKLDGCAPSFVTARDAIIAADQATTGGENFCMIWDTFARRGLGVNASAGGNSWGNVAHIQDQVEDFTTPPPGPNCVLAVDQFQNEKAIRVYPNPTKGQLNIAINNYSGKLSIQVFDLNGRKVYNQEVNDFNAESAINLANLQSGMYLIKVNGENLNYTEKIIIN